ncbi:ATP-binding cassette domain-containing protein [Spiroplasma endosymbiont of Panorpa germanica]|uniref:ATP-binding cassette domain-containing protein n=1 Tax=Spiroplasma endosymbiont of Panorpa germanica TaxID=3066314 RepID=UPI0030CB662F
MEKLLIVNNITQKRGATSFYENISFYIMEKSINQLVDIDESNMLKIISGQSNFQSGGIFLNGLNVFEASLVKKISYVLDLNKLPEKMVLQNYLSYCGKLKSITKKESEEKLVELIRYFEIDDLLFVKIFKLSKIQKFKITLLIAMLNNPEIILLDLDSDNFSHDEINIVTKSIHQLNESGTAFIIRILKDEESKKQFKINFSKTIYLNKENGDEG